MHTIEACRTLGVQSVLEAGSGAQALEILSSLEILPNALLVDLEMPAMDGIELIQQLKKRGFIVPIIVASGRESGLIQLVESMAQNLGFLVLAGLRKPLTPESLHRAFRGKDVSGTASSPRVLGPEIAVTAAQLVQAISAEQISVHYQPKVDICSGVVRGVEALARWSVPDIGYIRPDRFIALAEREGLIHDLSLQVMRQVFLQTADWNARGLRFSVAMNVSPMLLQDQMLVEEISKMAERYGVAAEQVILEITETSVVAYTDAALGVLGRLRLKGFGLSIDDYGTGFSAMQQLARIPFTELKIDRTFVHGAHDRKNLRVILQSALEMARRLELVTVAEGVESMEDWRLLQSFGCDIGQGFLIAKPMPPADIPNWLKRHQPELRQLKLRPAPQPICNVRLDNAVIGRKFDGRN